MTVIQDHQQLIAIKSNDSYYRNIKKLEQQLYMAKVSILEKDKIIEGLRVDLANLVEQLPDIMPDKYAKTY